MPKKIFFYVIYSFLLIGIISTTPFLLSCRKTQGNRILLAVTTSVYDSGLLNKLIVDFEKSSEYIVIPIIVGTGEAISLGQKGLVDVVFVHSREDEEEFMKEGYGSQRKDVMYNNFILVGPKNAPAHIQGLSIVEAFRIIQAEEHTFISRGDDSGTHKREMAIWKEAGVFDPLSIKEKWYLKSGQEMIFTLKIADEKKGYALTDKATYTTVKDALDLKILIEDDGNLLFNPYGIIAVNPLKHKDLNINYLGALSFIDYIVSKEGQKIINEFGLLDLGENIFSTYS